MFHILQPSEFLTTQWKNGGGITHEIAQEPGPNQWLWRISIAEVATDGPFSHFPGLSRILTVIEGAGIRLVHSKGQIDVHPLQPASFDGELAIEGCLMDGPIRDLNVIFDAHRIAARVAACNGPVMLDAGPDLVGYLALSGRAVVEDRTIPQGAFALGSHGQIELLSGASGISVRLVALSPTT